MAIVDPQFVMSMPRGPHRRYRHRLFDPRPGGWGFVYASPYTDSNAMQAIRMVFKYLPIAYEHPHDEEARTMMHNAACIAAMAFSNASVGVMPRAGSCLRCAIRCRARPGERAHAAACHCL